MLKPIKRRIVHMFPSAVAAYHSFRSARQSFGHTAKETPFGFRIEGHAAMQTGVFEQTETALLQRLLPQVETFVDVGANIGFYACLARQQGAHVIAVEPSDQNLQFLLANLARNGWSDVEVFPVALAEAPGIAPLYGEGTGASLIRRWSGTSEVWRRLVPVSTLDRLLAGRPSNERLLIKVDVEGFEHAVLDGATATLRREPPPTWLVEVCLTEHHPGGQHPHFNDVFECFWRAGYEAQTVEAQLRGVTREDVTRWVSKSRQDFGGINFIFSRPSSAAP